MVARISPSLAAYEAAIGPALRAVSGIGLQSSAKVNEPKKKARQPKAKKKGKDSRQPAEGNVAGTGAGPQVSAHRSELRSELGRGTREADGTASVACRKAGTRDPNPYLGTCKQTADKRLMI